MKKILIGEDDTDIRFLVRIHLRDYDIQILDARNGEEVIHVIEKELPDMVLVDYMLPIKNGYEVAKWMRENEFTRAIPVVLLTMRGFDLRMKQIENAEYLPKPFTKEELCAVIEKYVGRLPQKENESAALPEWKKEIRKQENGPKKILIADDEDVIIELVGEILNNSMSGIEIIKAGNGQELVEKSIAEKPDLIITDVIMPKLSGWRGIKQLRQKDEFSHIPVIFNSGLVRDKELYETLKPEGPSCFILKPFKKDILVKKVKEFLGV